MILPELLNKIPLESLKRLTDFLQQFNLFANFILHLPATMEQMVKPSEAVGIHGVQAPQHIDTIATICEVMIQKRMILCQAEKRRKNFSVKNKRNNYTDSSLKGSIDGFFLVISLACLLDLISEVMKTCNYLPT